MTLDPRDGPAAGRPQEVLEALVRFVFVLYRGRTEFRRTYGLSEGSEPQAGTDPQEFVRRLQDPQTAESTQRTLLRMMSEVMLHQAAILEGYQEAVQSGTRSLLSRLNPAELAEGIEGAGVKLGPFTLSARSGPLLMQAVWEEFLRRFEDLSRLDPAELQRLYRDGFRAGYASFHETRDLSVTEEGAGDPSSLSLPGEGGGS